MTASMQLDQAGLLPAGTPNFAREDGLFGGQIVTLTSLAHEKTFRFRLLWVGQHPVPDTNSVPSLQQSGVNTWEFEPTPNVFGSWRIELITDEGTASEDRQIRIFAIKPSPNSPRIPAANEISDPEANLATATPSNVAALIQRSEFNAPNGIAGSPFEFGTYVSWYKSFSDAVFASSGLLVVDRTSFVGTSHTLTADDFPVGRKLLLGTDAAAMTLSVDSNANVPRPIGDSIALLRYGAGSLTVQGINGAVVQTAKSLSARAQYSAIVLTKIDVDEWLLTGDMT